MGHNLSLFQKKNMDNMVPGPSNINSMKRNFNKTNPVLVDSDIRQAKKKRKHEKKKKSKTLVKVTDRYQELLRDRDRVLRHVKRDLDPDEVLAYLEAHINRSDRVELVVEELGGGGAGHAGTACGGTDW